VLLRDCRWKKEKAKNRQRGGGRLYDAQAVKYPRCVLQIRDNGVVQKGEAFSDKVHGIAVLVRG